MESGYEVGARCWTAQAGSRKGQPECARRARERLLWKCLKKESGLREDLTKRLAVFRDRKLGPVRDDQSYESRTSGSGSGVSPVACECGAGRLRENHSQATGKKMED